MAEKNGNGWKSWALSVSGGCLLIGAAVVGWLGSTIWNRVDVQNEAIANIRIRQATETVRVDALERNVEEMKNILKQIEINTRR